MKKRMRCARSGSSLIPHPSSFDRRGFSFPEVLFAVAVLGIGFIMVAAIFPVAIMQTQATLEETVGTAVTRNGVSYVRGSPLMTASKLPFTGTTLAPAAPTPPNPGLVYSFNDPRIDITQPPNNLVPPNTINKAQPNELWNSIKQNLIVADDPRFAYVPLYIRDTGSNFAKLIVVGVRIRNRDAFKAATQGTDIGDVERRGNACAELEPRPVRVELIDGTATNSPDRIIIENINSGTLQQLSQDSDAVQAAAPGGYVIISEDTIPDQAGTLFKNEHGRLNGRVFRLGPETNIPPPPANARQFELAVGDDMTGPAEDMTGAIAFVIGRGYAATSGNSYSGPSMAVQHYENIIPLP